MAKTEQSKIGPKPGVPTLNPITGRKFVDEAEKQAFIDEQQAKFDAAISAQQGRQAQREAATVKIMQIFAEAGVTEHEVKLVFGRQIFR